MPIVQQIIRCLLLWVNPKRDVYQIPSCCRYRVCASDATVLLTIQYNNISYLCSSFMYRSRRFVCTKMFQLYQLMAVYETVLSFLLNVLVLTVIGSSWRLTSGRPFQIEGAVKEKITLCCLCASSWNLDEEWSCRNLVVDERCEERKLNWLTDFKSHHSDLKSYYLLHWMPMKWR